VVLLTLAAGVFAWAYGDLVALLGTFAFGTFGAALAPALAVGLNWRRVPAAAATASIATGLVVNLGLELLARAAWLPAPPLPPGVPPAAVALAASFSVLFAVTWGHRRRAAPSLDADVAAVMDV
jgi:Na+/proline symporter